ncbi:hypothetical protein LCGC14_1995650, partial [marine sediment metagenome]
MPPTGHPAAVSETIEIDGATPAESLAGPARVVVIGGTILALVLVVNQLFNIQLFGLVLIDGRYLYILGGMFLALTFLVFQAGGSKGKTPSILDWGLFAVALGCTAYLSQTAQDNLAQGWEYAAPTTAQWVAVVFFLLILEATRRAGGLVLFIIVTVFAFYPTFAGHVPDPFSGFQSTFLEAIPYHVYSAESSFGIPMKAFGGVVIGFIVFGAVLQRTGGGQFFNDLALGMVGGYRGGAAKVSIFASGFMGSMSGSVISNVLTTGAVSIPAMRKTGFSARTAAATEACASTGGVLMPPIMGATAFVMASFLSRPYVEIALAAAIPSLLFYFGLFAQIDAYSARRGLKGLPRPDLPVLRQVMKEGWPYIFVFALLLFMMVALRRETSAPFYATVLLLIVTIFTYLAFAKELPWRQPFELHATFKTSNVIALNSPVRIAGVGVGKVTGLDHQEGTDIAVVTMEIAEDGLPIHKDATLKVRNRIFLEGNFFVDLQPGTPQEATVASGDTIPVT